MKITKKRINNKKTGLKSLFTGNIISNYPDQIFFPDLKESRANSLILTSAGMKIKYQVNLNHRL
jgi:hypothetical protein